MNVTGLEKITSITQYSCAVMSMMKRGVVTNCFISTPAINAAISEETLYIHKSENALFVFRAFPSAVRMNFYLFGQASMPKVDFGKPIVSELYVKNTEPCADNEIFMRDFFHRSGFEQYTKRIRLEGSGNNLEKHKNVSLALAKESDLQEFHRLLSQRLDPISGCVPSRGELAHNIKNGLCAAFYSDETVVGALNLSQNKRACEICHLAVDKSFCGRGIAKNLVGGICRKAFESARSVGVWTGEDNLPARNLYMTAGLEETPQRSFVYLKK